MFGVQSFSYRATKVKRKSDSGSAHNTKVSFTGRDALKVFEHWEEIASIAIKDPEKLKAR